MSEALSALLCIGLYLFVGYLVYRHKWPEGFVAPEEQDGELERIGRIVRRRVRPLPPRIERRVDP